MMPLSVAAASTATAAPVPSFESLLERPDLAWMGQNTTHLDPPDEVVQALLESTRRREFQLYAPALGFHQLRTLIVEDLGLHGVEALVTDGAVGGLHHICTALSGGLSRLITTDPGWPWPGRFVQFAGVPVTTIPVYSQEDGYRLRAEQLAEVIEDNCLIYLIDPLNPLGSSYGRAELQAIADLARSTGSLIVHDCTYRHFAYGHSLVAELYPEGTITTYSFSKWLGLAGLRLGAIVGTEQLLKPLAAVPANPLGANIQAQRAAIAGLKVKDPWLQRLRATNIENQRIVTAAIAASGLGQVLVQPSHGNFLAVDIGDSDWTADKLAAACLDANIFIRAGTYQSPRFGQRFVKISTSVPTEWAERLADVWLKLSAEVPR